MAFGGIAIAAFEIAAAKMAVHLHVPDHGLDGGAATQLVMRPKTPRLWPEMKTRCGLAVSWPR
jgi:hypothetical protein